MDKVEFNRRKTAALEDLYKQLQHTPQPSPYSVEAGGSDYQIGIERVRKDNGRKQRDDDNHNRIVYNIRDRTEACADTDALWKFIADELKSFPIKTNFFRTKEEGGGVDWNKVHDGIQEIAVNFSIRHVYQKRATCLRLVYSKFWK